MRISELREILYEIAKQFWIDAEVVWAETQSTESTLPYVTLRFRDMTSARDSSLDDDGTAGIYNCSVPFEVNLYTMGKKMSSQDCMDTAVDDLTDFIRFLESDEIMGELEAQNIAILPSYPVRSLSGLFDNVRYKYRAMAEFTVSFQQSSDGAYGLYGRDLPNVSGGGTSTHSEEEISWIEEVELEEEDEE
ncbi:MAG: hypothetical protein LUC83_01255 [Clostridiales bacterium]|nr:hypothetical protein [Clostridiales bacterium]